MIAINSSLEIVVYCSQQDVESWSHSAELNEQPVVLSISVASFVAGPLPGDGLQLTYRLSPELSCHHHVLGVFLNPLHGPSSGSVEWAELRKKRKKNIFTTVRF